MGVSKNRDTPKSLFLIGFSIINHPFWGTTIFGNTHIISCDPKGFEYCDPRSLIEDDQIDAVFPGEPLADKVAHVTERVDAMDGNQATNSCLVDFIFRVVLLMAEILHLFIGSLSHYL